MTFSRDPVFLPLRDMDTSVCFRQPLVIVLPSCYNSRTSMTFWLLLVAYDHDANQWVIVIIALNAPFLNQRHGTDIQTNRGTKIFFGGGDRAGSPFNTRSPGPRPSSIPSDIWIHAATWPQQIWAENWGLCPFGEGGAGSPSNTMWPVPKPTCVPSFVLIRPTVSPQCTNVTDRQTGQTDRQTDNVPIA